MGLFQDEIMAEHCEFFCTHARLFNAPAEGVPLGIVSRRLGS